MTNTAPEGGGGRHSAICQFTARICPSALTTRRMASPCESVTMMLIGSAKSSPTIPAARISV